MLPMHQSAIAYARARGTDSGQARSPTLGTQVRKSAVLRISSVLKWWCPVLTSGTETERVTTC
eukprot:3095761-Rhodomonas_salina.3